MEKKFDVTKLLLIHFWIPLLYKHAGAAPTEVRNKKCEHGIMLRRGTGSIADLRSWVIAKFTGSLPFGSAEKYFAMLCHSSRGFATIR